MKCIIRWIFLELSLYKVKGVFNGIIISALNLIVVFYLFSISNYTYIPIILLAIPLFYYAGREYFIICNVQIIILLTLYKNIFLLTAFNIDPDLINFAYLPVSFGFDYIYAVTFFIFCVYFKIITINKNQSILLFVFAGYCILGVIFSSVVSVVSYSRFYIIPFFCFLLGNSVGVNEKLLNVILGTLVIYFILVYIEIFYPGYYEFISANAFADIKYYNNPDRAYEMYDLVSRMGTTINEIRINRVLGSQMHPISVGYSLLALAVISSLYSRKLVSCLSVPLLFACALSSKGAFGAMVCFYSSLILYYLGFRKLVFIVILLYASVLMFLATTPGLSSGYEHYLGLIGAIENIIFRPFGLGIGAGGTMSALKGPSYGGESGIGTMISHLGFIAVIGYYCILKRILKVSLNSESLLICSTYIILILINALLQEEALAPSSVFIAWLLLGMHFHSNNSELNEV